MFFKIKGKIINVYDKKVKVLLYNDDEIQHFNHILSLMKKKPNDNNTYNMTIHNFTKFNIDKNINFNNFKDLLNLNVIISGKTKYYCFDPNRLNKSNVIINNFDDQGCQKMIQGHTFIINKLSNNYEFV